MVRILKVKPLEDRRRMLVARSEIYRQTLRVEIAGLKSTALAHKESFGLFQNAWRLGRVGASVVRFFRGHPDKGNGTGFVSRLLSGIKFAVEILPLIKNLQDLTRPGEKAGDDVSKHHSD